MARYDTEETVAIGVWKSGGLSRDELSQVFALLEQIARIVDDGETPFDVDLYTDDVLISSGNIEPGYGREEA